MPTPTLSSLSQSELTLPELIDHAIDSGWTLTGLARASGVSQPHITKLRQGEVSEQSRQGLKLKNFLENQKERGWHVAGAALGRVLERHPARHREIIRFIQQLDALLSGPPTVDPTSKARRGRRPKPRPRKRAVTESAPAQ
jgi:hypothetical protein